MSLNKKKNKIKKKKSKKKEMANLDSPLFLEDAAAPTGKVQCPTWVKCLIAFLVLALISVVIMLVVQKVDKKPDASKDLKQVRVRNLEVQGAVRPTSRVDVWDHVLYFTFQEDADYFKFYINDQMVGSGTFEELDLRYDPAGPYRRAAIQSSISGEHPVRYKIETFDQNVNLIGQGEQTMTIGHTKI